MPFHPGFEVRGYATSEIVRGTLAGPRAERCQLAGCLYTAALFGPVHNANAGFPGQSGVASQLVFGVEMRVDRTCCLRWKGEYVHTFFTGTVPDKDNGALLLGFVVRLP